MNAWRAWSWILVPLVAGAGCGGMRFHKEARNLVAERFSHAGIERTVWRTRANGEPKPLVLALHGGGGTALGMAKLTGLTALAKREGFVVAYPDSEVKAWNDGRKDVKGRDVSRDDSGFLAALARDYIERGIADPKRVYVCGISNGGAMTHRMACEHPQLFGAAAMVAMNRPLDLDCGQGSPLPMLFVVGTEDPLVPYAGGDIRVLRGRSRGRVDSFEDSFEFWSRKNRSAAEIDSRLLEDLDPQDGTRVRLRLRPAGRQGADTMAYVVEGGGHTWPGGWPYLGEWAVGRVSRDLSASQAIWKFFKEHPRP